MVFSPIWFTANSISFNYRQMALNTRSQTICSVICCKWIVHFYWHIYCAQANWIFFTFNQKMRNKVQGFEIICIRFHHLKLVFKLMLSSAVGNWHGNNKLIYKQPIIKRASIWILASVKYSIDVLFAVLSKESSSNESSAIKSEFNPFNWNQLMYLPGGWSSPVWSSLDQSVVYGPGKIWAIRATYSITACLTLEIVEISACL